MGTNHFIQVAKDLGRRPKRICLLRKLYTFADGEDDDDFNNVVLINTQSWSGRAESTPQAVPKWTRSERCLRSAQKIHLHARCESFLTFLQAHDKRPQLVILAIIEIFANDTQVALTGHYEKLTAVIRQISQQYIDFILMSSIQTTGFNTRPDRQ